MRYLLLCSFIMLAGCTTEWYVGEWEVKDAKFPGISAIGMEQARDWFGSRALYSETAVNFRDEYCNNPVFATESLSEAEFQTNYRATFLALDIDGDWVDILHVGCPAEWVSPASTLIRSNSDTAYMLWDGAYFKLEKT